MSVKPAKPSTRYKRHLAAKLPPQKIMRGSLITPLVYFVRATTMGLIKIGATLDVNDRLQSLQVGSPDKLVLMGAIYDKEAFDIERRLHARFTAHRSHGEWFRPCAELLDLIEEYPLSDMVAVQKAELRAALEATYSAQPQEPT